MSTSRVFTVGQVLPASSENELAQGVLGIARGTANVGPTSGGLALWCCVDSPSAGSHTYKATIQRSSGTGTATVDGGSTFPITITVEDVGVV